MVKWYIWLLITYDNWGYNKSNSIFICQCFLFSQSYTNIKKHFAPSLNVFKIIITILFQQMLEICENQSNSMH